MPDKTKLKEGDIFYVYNDYYKRYFFGKILVDIFVIIIDPLYAVFIFAVETAFVDEASRDDKFMAF